MKRGPLARARVDWRIPLSALALAVAALFLIEPVLAPGFPLTPDGPVHLFRVAHLDKALIQGEVYPRWLPDLFGGYGYPLFNYYAPAFYYVAEGIHALGFDLLLAVKLAVVVAIVIGTFGAYLLARDAFGELAGVAAGVAYVYAPHYAEEVTQRGGLAQLLALSLLPMTLWAFRRAALGNSIRRWLLATLLVVVVVLSHNITAMLFAPVLAAYVGLLIIALRSTRRALYAIGSVVLAAGLAAFFWAPAMLERDLVRTSALTGGDFDFHRHFIPLWHLFSFPPVLDRASANAHYFFTIGPAHIVLGLFGFCAARLARGWRPLVRLEAVYFAVVAVIAAFLTQSPSAPVWETVPLLPYVEHPWRWLGIVALSASFLVGASVHVLCQLRHARFWVVPVIVGLIVVITLPMLYPSKYLQFSTVTISDALGWEQSSQAWGTTSANEFLPARVMKLPQLEEPPQPVVAPTNAEVITKERRPSYQAFDVTIAEPARITVNTFYFEGWYAFLDGQSWDVHVLEPSGLIAVDVPAGRHTLELRLEPTVIRQIATVASLVSAALFAIVTAIELALSVRRRAVGEGTLVPGARGAIGRQLLVIGVLAGLFLAKALVVDPYLGWFSFASSGDRIAGMSTSAGITYGGVLRLIGFNAEFEHWRPGEVREVSLFWRLAGENPPREPYSVSVHLIDEQSRSWAQNDHYHPDGQPTNRWDERYVKTDHILRLPDTAPPGRYFVAVCVYPHSSERCLPRSEVLAPPSLPIPDPIASFVVHQPTDAKPPAPGSLDLEFDRGPRLVGVGPKTGEARPGERVSIALYWSTNQPIERDFTVFLHVAGPDGRVLAQSDGEPQNGRYHTSLWLPGETVEDWRTVDIPAASRPGAYELRIGLYDPASGERLRLADGADFARIGQITIR